MVVGAVPLDQENVDMIIQLFLTMKENSASTKKHVNSSHTVFISTRKAKRIVHGKKYEEVLKSVVIQ